MADASLSARFADGDFSVGRVLNRTSSVLSRNFLTFFVVIAVAHLPTLLLSKGSIATATPTSGGEIFRSVVVVGFGIVLWIVLSTLSQAIVLYAAFQDMRGRQVSLVESLQVGLRRFVAIIGLAIAMTLLGALAAILLVFPAFILFTMWFVATPACVVEQLGPSKSMRRSAQLTKGHRWKVFGLMLVMWIASGVAGQTLATSLTAIGGTPLALVGEVLWGGLWGAFYAIAVVVTYHELRAAKEGVDIEQIAAVFD